MKKTNHKEINIKNINVQISLTVFLCILFLSAYFIISSYNSSIRSEERNVLKTLHAITSVVSQHVSGDEHESMFNNHTKKNGIVSNTDDTLYYKIHKILSKASIACNLNSPLYTAVYNEEKQEFLMGVTSSETPSFRHSYTSFPKEVLVNYQIGGVVPTYKDEYDSWLSAFSPLKNSAGEVVAIIQTDVTFTGFINEARAQLKMDIILSLIAIMLIGVVMFFSLRTILKRDNIIKTSLLESNRIIKEKQNELLDSLSYAKRIQTAILPPSKLVKEYLENSFILYKPKDIVAGDFYWMEHKDGKVLFAAADCTGHGVPGAMVSVICNNGLNRSVREYNLTDPGKILDKTREIVIQEFEKSEDEVKDGMDIALCSLHNNTLQYAGANNPLWIIRNNSTEIEEIKATKQPIGKYGNPKPYTTHTIELQKGDSIYIFSDGYADQFGGEKGKKFKGANFKKLLLSIQQETMERQKELINQAFENWRGELEQIDDVCVIGVKV